MANQDLRKPLGQRTIVRVAIVAVIALLVLCRGFAEQAKSPDLVVTNLHIPTGESGKKGLAAVMIRPNDSLPHPLALVTHGTPQDYSQLSPFAYFFEAQEFARRGWTTVIVLRRGFGDSGGDYAENPGPCGPMTDYEGVTRQAAIDLRAAAIYLDSRPEVDASRMIAIGHSTGGLAVVGLTANPPPNLVAAISFAGGRGHGSSPPGQVCAPETLISAFASFGKRARVPMLWVYATNDQNFGPDLAEQLYGAYTRGGGKVTFIRAAPFAQDGHRLFSEAGIPIWTAMVDDFLKRQNLALRDTLLDIPPPAVAPPDFLPQAFRKDFQLYLYSPAHKAFAASKNGHIGYVSGRPSVDDARKHALEACKKSAPKYDPCTIAMVDDQKISTN